MMNRLKSSINQLRTITSGKFSARAGLILLGSALGQGITFLLLPATTRIYGAEAIGQAATTLAILNVLGLLASLQYDQAVIVSEDEDLPYLLTLASILPIGLVFCIIILLLLLNTIWAEGFDALSAYGFNEYLVGLLLTYPLFLLLTNFQLRSNYLGRVSAGRLIYYGGGASLQVIGGFLVGGKASVFLLAQIIAALFAILYLFPYKKTYHWVNCYGIEITKFVRNVRNVAKKYSNFPRYQVGAQTLNTLSVQIPILILRVAFSDAWAGWYFIAYRLLAAPTVLLSQAVGQVFYRDSAERERYGSQQAKNLEQLVIGLIRISLLPGIALGVTAPIWIGLFLGEEWLPVAYIMQILLIPFVVSFFTSPISTFLNVKNRQKAALMFNALLFGGRVAALLIAWRLQNEWLAVWGYALASIMILLPFFRYVVHSAGGSVWQIYRYVKYLLFDAAFLLIVTIIIKQLQWLTEWQGLLLFGILFCFAVWREFQRRPHYKLQAT